MFLYQAGSIVISTRNVIYLLDFAAYEQAQNMVMKQNNGALKVYTCPRPAKALCDPAFECLLDRLPAFI